MSTSMQGSLSLVSTLYEQISPGSGLPTYSVPIQPSSGLLTSYTNGTGPNQALKSAMASLTATAAPVDTDLTTILCVDGSTGFSHVRERIIINLDAANPLKTGNDGVVTNPWVPYYASGTSPVRTVEPGAIDRVSKPLGANGYAVSAGSKTVRVDPGAATVNYVLIVVGD